MAVVRPGGRWAYAVKASVIGRVTQDAQAAVALARRQSFRLVADYLTLRFDTPSRPDESTLRHLVDLLPNVLAILHAESNARMGNGDAA